ncbi:SET domain-containing protein [Polyplosphaeria fusca]|uniref:SET domain-containing protein n=1 Tax=Polyplosphaeria fusca TaxID=682080 RepID=A0A9P4UWY5_9PLEO|nr:SET domain-containing protein [Polyplosphaeria fusca]
MMVILIWLYIAVLAHPSLASTWSTPCHPFNPTEHQLPLLSQHSHLTTCPGPPENWHVTPSPGKGLGVFATRALEEGTIVMREAPSLLITPPPIVPGYGYNVTEVGLRVQSAFDSLSPALQSEILSLHAHFKPGESSSTAFARLKAIFRSNAYNTGKDIGLFPKIARINHSCRPNAGYVWNERLGRRVVFANRRIEEGEEITDSYVPLLLSRRERQQRLDTYGFRCKCEACRVGEEEGRKSDRRRRDIKELLGELERGIAVEAKEDGVGRKKAKRLAKKSAKVVGLVEDEELPEYFAKAYRYAAVFHSRTQAWENATLWAEQGLRHMMMADSESQETKDMLQLTERCRRMWDEEQRNKTSSKETE